MLAPSAHQQQNADKANALIPRLEQVNQAVKKSDVSPSLIEASLRIGMVYAVFLTEVQDGSTALSPAEVTMMLGRTEHHCELYEKEFPAKEKGANA